LQSKFYAAKIVTDSDAANGKVLKEDGISPISVREIGTSLKKTKKTFNYFVLCAFIRIFAT